MSEQIENTSRDELRARIVDADDLEPEPVEIPEWGISKGELFLRPLDGASRWRLSQLAKAANANGSDEPSRILEAYVCESLVDKNNVRIFSIDERELLASKDPNVVERLWDRVLQISGMDSDAEELIEKK